WDEGLRECALGEEAPEQVRNLERDEERVHDEAGAEPVRKPDVAGEPGDPRDERHRADDAGRGQQRPAAGFTAHAKGTRSIHARAGLTWSLGLRIIPGLSRPSAGTQTEANVGQYQIR